MAMPNLSEFDPDGDPRNVLNIWTKWVHDFRVAMVSFKITCEKRQRALLRFYGGDELTDILESLNDTGTEDEIEPAIEALTRYFSPARNCEEKGHSGHAQGKECSGHVRGHGGDIHHFTRCCGSSVQFVRYTGDKSNVKTDTDEKPARNTYKRETMTGNDQNTHTGKETKAAQEKKSPTREVKQKKSPTREVNHEKSPTREVKHEKSPTREVKHEKSPTREVKHENPPVREVKHENPPVREVKHENPPTREVKQKKSPNREVTQAKSPTRKVKLKDSHQGDVKQSDSHKRDVKPNDSYKRDVKQNDSHTGDVKHNDSHKSDVKQNDSHQGDVKQNGSHKDVKQNDSHKGDVKQNDSHKRDVKQNDSHKGDVKQNDSHKGDVKQNDSYKGDVNQKDSHKDVNQSDSYKGDVKRNDSHKRDVNKINRKHVRKRVVVDQNLYKRRDVNKINTGDEVKQETTAVHTVIWKINNVSAGKSVKKKQISRRKKGKERHSAKKSHVKYSIIACNKVHVKGKEYKSDVEPPDIPDREEPEQVVIQPRHYHKSRPPNSFNYVAN